MAGNSEQSALKPVDFSSLHFLPIEVEGWEQVI
jgi:hypothetical protein